MELSEVDRNRMRLWRRWEITFDWMGYTPPLKRVHIAMLVHPQPWSTRALAEFTQLPQTTVRRHLEAMEKGNSVDRTEDGFEISEQGVALVTEFHSKLARYVRGGVRLDSEVLELLKRAPNIGKTNFDKLETHVWLPIIGETGMDDT